VRTLSVIRALITAVLIASFCLSTPAVAGSFGSSFSTHKTAANSYRDSLQKLRTRQLSTTEQTEKAVTPLHSSGTAAPSLEQEAAGQPKIDAHLHKHLPKNRSPYAIIAAARQPNHAFSLTPPLFVEQLPQQINQLRADLQAQPIKIVETVRQIRPAAKQSVQSVRDRLHRLPQSVKNTLSNVLELAGTKAHQTAEQLRQTN
jgi:hypothetical protein